VRLFSYVRIDQILRIEVDTSTKACCDIRAKLSVVRQSPKPGIAPFNFVFMFCSSEHGARMYHHEETLIAANQGGNAFIHEERNISKI